MNLTRAFAGLTFSQKILKIKKKKRDVCFIVWLYGFFLSKIKPTMAIAMIIAITATYVPFRSDVVAKFD